MKKSLVLVLILSLLFSFSLPAYAATATTAALSSINYTHYGSQDKITINTTNSVGYKVMWLDNPDRLVIDIPNNKVTITGSQTIKIDSQNVISVRFSQFTATTARVVFDTKGKIPYSVSTTGGVLTFTLGKAAAAPTPTPPAPTGVSRGGDSDRPELAVQRLVFSRSEGYDKIIIPGTGYDGYNIMRLTDPDRLVIDVPNLKVAQDQQLIQTDGLYLKAIRTSAIDASKTRIVLDTIGQPEYSIEKDDGQLALVLKESPLINLAYHNSGDRIYVSLKDTKLTEIIPNVNTNGSLEESDEEGDSLNQLFTGTYGMSKMKYSMTFPENLAKLGAGSLQINDGIINSIDITKNAIDDTITLTFNAKTQMVYDTLTNPETGETEISLLKSFDPKDRLVVIDAGHGGSDPGATYAGLEEKDFNLTIALNVNEILKSKGIKTYMTRDDDTFVPLKTRSEIANNLNAALFLSIHNNAYNSSEHGTETLYYPGTAGKAFARIVQDKLVGALGTYDRGIVERPNLVVLNSTKMPAVIAEIAFLTNTDDRALLKDDAFIQKSAKALADAVIKALE